MPDGLRAADAPTINDLIGGDQRLLLRVGALLQAQIACTPLLLEEAASSQGLRALLLDRALADVADAEALLALTNQHGADELALETDRADGWRVLALADEIGNPLLAAPEPSVPVVAAPSVQALLPSLGREVRAGVEGLLEARADDQRAAALEQLRYLAPSLDLVTELMPLVLADDAELVRERAISLLVAAGAKPSVVDLIRALHAGDDIRITRLIDTIKGQSSDQIDLVLAAVIATVGRGQISPAVVSLCTELAPDVARHPQLARLLELLLVQGGRLSLLGLVRALQQHDSAAIDQALMGMLGQGAQLDARILVLLARPEVTAADALLERGVDLLLADDPEPDDRMALAAALRRMDHGGQRLGRLLAELGGGIGKARDAAPYWLIGELCQDGLIAEADGDRLLEHLRSVVQDHRSPHLMAVLEQQLPQRLPASDSNRAAMVEALAELVQAFRDARSTNILVSAIEGLGDAAETPLWRLLEEHPTPRVRWIAAMALSRILAGTGADRLRAAITRLLAAVRRESHPADAGYPLTTAAQLADDDLLADDPETTATVDVAARRLGGAAAIPAWGYLAAGRHLTPERRVALVEALLTGICDDVPDTETHEEVDPVTQTVTFVLDARLSAHTEAVPEMLDAIARIGVSPHLPAALLRRIVGSLSAHWQRVSSWEVIWGPGNVMQLADTLASLGERDGLPNHLRSRIANALMPKISQLNVASAIARTLADDHEGHLAGMAQQAALRLLQYTGNGNFADDEQALLADTAAAFLMLEHLGDDDDDGAVLRRRLAGVLAGARKDLGQRSRERLRAWLERNPDHELERRLEWLQSSAS